MLLRWLIAFSLCSTHRLCYFYKLSSEVQGPYNRGMEDLGYTAAIRFENSGHSVQHFGVFTQGVDFHSTQHYNSSLFHNYVQKIGPKLITYIDIFSKIQNHQL